MTASDGEIEFGEVKAAERGQHLRPDRNAQFRVVACGCPSDDDLPIFVDLDALGDLEAHALSDPRVELGGVVLGGQYEDDRGRPFVVIADALRAQHHESTPGSFKFTHETWAEFTRRQAALPADLQIVGWYHTHPNLGVFLSEMDRFICEHFFARPGDVALVIDPCRGQRGFFQWTGEVPNRTRRTGGFYLFASRHREVELMCFAAYLEGKFMGANDPRSSASPLPGMPYPVSPRSSTDPPSFWIGQAVLGVLFLQFLLLALLAWKTLVPESTDSGGTAPPRVRTATVAAGSDAAGDVDRVSREAEIQLRLLDRIVDQLGQGTPRGLVPMLEQLQQENEALKADARVYRTLEAKVKAENETLAGALAAAEEDKGKLASQVAQLEVEIREKDRAQDDYRRQIARLNELLAPAAPAGASVVVGDWIRQPKIWGLAGVGILLAGTLLWAALSVRKRRRESPAVGQPGLAMNPASALQEERGSGPASIR